MRELQTLKIGRRLLPAIQKPSLSCLLFLGAGLLLMALFRLVRGNAAAMAFWVERVSMPLKRLLSLLVDPLPFSAAELSCTAAGIWAVWFVVHSVRQSVLRRSLPLGPLCLLAAVALWIYLGITALWGTQYYAPTFQDRSGLRAVPLSVAQLESATAYFAQRVNETAEGVVRDETGAFAVPMTDIFARAGSAYNALEEEYPCLRGPVRTPKKAFYSKVMSACGFTGYLFPLLGESTLNVDCPAVFLPVTIAHEQAHQRGVASELEANYCGIRAATGCGMPDYAYSGWLFGYLHLSNALYKADRSRWQAVDATLCPAAHRDLSVNNAYWAAWESPVKETAQNSYESFLRSYDQELGMKSYGACVDLLVAWLETGK